MVTRRTLMELAGAVVASAAAGSVVRARTMPAAAPGAAATGTVATGTAAMGGAPKATGKPAFVFFSKHLADLAVPDLASAVIDMGFAGVDLTVRPGGHVLPERAAEDLPRAVEAIRGKGTTVAMITTALTSASDPTARPIMQAAAKAGVRLIKPGYWRYALKDVRGEVAAMGRDLAGLATLAREQGVTLGVHNHAGNVGSALWEIAPYIDKLDASAIGYYFDPRHAIVEGGQIGWKAATQLVLPRLEMIAVKDFYWEKPEGKWRLVNCPIGDGMVEWPWFASTIVHAGFSGPISLHVEYDVKGATPDEERRNMMAAARRDLEAVRTHFAAVKA